MYHNQSLCFLALIFSSIFNISFSNPPLQLDPRFNHEKPGATHGNFIFPNEDSPFLFRPALEGKTNTLVCVGSFRCLNNISNGSFSRVVMMDFDSAMTSFNLWHLNLIRNSKNRKDYLEKLTGVAFSESDMRDPESLLKTLTHNSRHMMILYPDSGSTEYSHLYHRGARKEDLESARAEANDYLAKKRSPELIKQAQETFEAFSKFAPNNGPMSGSRNSGSLSTYFMHGLMKASGADLAKWTEDGFGVVVTPDSEHWDYRVKNFGFSYIGSETNFEKVKKLIELDKAHVVLGSLNGGKALNSVSDFLNARGETISAIDVSNAPVHRDTLLKAGLPLDQDALYLQVGFSHPKEKFGVKSLTEGNWSYSATPFNDPTSERASDFCAKALSSFK